MLKLYFPEEFANAWVDRYIAHHPELDEQQKAACHITGLTHILYNKSAPWAGDVVTLSIAEATDAQKYHVHLCLIKLDEDVPFDEKAMMRELSAVFGPIDAAEIKFESLTNKDIKERMLRTGAIDPQLIEDQLRSFKLRKSNQSPLSSGSSTPASSPPHTPSPGKKNH